MVPYQWREFVFYIKSRPETELIASQVGIRSLTAISVSLEFKIGSFPLLTLAGWPHDFGLTDVNNPNSPDGWKFAAIQGMPWFSAAFLGSYLSDPLSEYIGRYVCGFCLPSSRQLQHRLGLPS